MSLYLSTLPTTAAPAATEVALRFAERQAAQTCGWVDANPNNPAVCSAGSTCAVNTVYDVHFCCSSFPCMIPTTCLASAAATTACNSDCQDNPLILKCTFAGFEACYTRVWEQQPPLSGYGCAPSPFLETVYTTNTAGIGQIAPGSTFGLAVATPVPQGLPHQIV